MSEKIRKVLFICSANQDRSQTAENHFTKKFRKFQFDSAGTNKKICFELGTSFLQEEQLAWADLIFVMEKKHKTFIDSHFSIRPITPIHVLNVPDHFNYGESKLIQLLESKVKPFLNI